MKTAVDTDVQKLSQEGLNLDTGIIGFAKFINLAASLKEAGIKGACGYAAHLIFLVIFFLPFVGKNIYREVVLNKNSVVSKDAVYDFLKSKSANWEKFLLIIASKVVQYFYSLGGIKRLRALVGDDTPQKKNRSSKLEYSSRCYDHAEDVYYRGFRTLNLTWTDGFSTVPLGFSLLASQKPENRYCDAKKPVDPRSNAAKRRTAAIQGAVRGLLRIVDMVFGVIAKTVDAIVFDSWYAVNELIFTLSKKLPVVCMVKKNNQLWFKFDGGEGTIEAVYRHLKKKSGRAHIIGSTVVTLLYNLGGTVEKLKCKIVFVRDRRNHDWIPLLCTNTKFSDKKIITLYGLRWSIEVFHRDTKQFLAFEKGGSQSTDYDALTAYVTVVYTRYIFLSLRRRMQEDKRIMGIGSVFYACCEEVKQISLEEAVLRTCADAVEALKSKQPAAHTENGEKAYTIDQMCEAMIEAAMERLKKSEIEVTMNQLIRRQKDIEKLGTCLALRLKGMVA